MTHRFDKCNAIRFSPKYISSGLWPTRSRLDGALDGNNLKAFAPAGPRQCVEMDTMVPSFALRNLIICNPIKMRLDLDVMLTISSVQWFLFTENLSQIWARLEQ